MGEPRDLHEDFPDLDTSDTSGYCGSGRDGCKSYRDWEKEIAKPAIERAGFTGVRFYSVEEDSFGPLIRGVEATDAAGQAVTWDYG